MQQRVIIILLSLISTTTRLSVCQEFQCIRQTPNNETSNDNADSDADSALIIQKHNWDIDSLRDRADLWNLTDLAALSRIVTPPELSSEEEQEPKPSLHVTCTTAGTADENRGGGDAGAAPAEGGGGRGGVWADVSDASAIPQIQELIPRITRLRVRHLTDADILSSLVANARVLRHLNLASASTSLGILPSSWLMGAKYRLTHLDASFCGITGISQGTFRDAPLRWLNLAGNVLKRLNAEALSSLTSVWHLDLSNNAIVELNDDAFRSLKELRSLDLSFNGLTKPYMKSVAPLSSLVVLSVGHNALGGAGPISLPRKLHVLLVKNAALGDGDLDLKEADEIRVLDVSGNGLTRLQALPKLQELNASANQLERLATWPELRALDVSFNAKLGHLCDSIAEVAAPKLRLLITDGVEQSYDSGVFLKSCKLSPHLSTLSAGNLATLKTLPQDAFQSISSENRVALRVSANAKLTHIDEGAFKGLRLQALDISQNALSSLSHGTANWPDLNAVNLQGNPWRCECNLQWMLDELLPDLYRWTPELLDDVRCAAPPELQGTRFVHWFNHSEGVFCDRTPLVRGERRAALKEVQLDVSSGALGVVIAAGVVAVLLVGLGIHAHHKYIRRLRIRNRRM